MLHVDVLHPHCTLVAVRLSVLSGNPLNTLIIQSASRTPNNDAQRTRGPEQQCTVPITLRSPIPLCHLSHSWSTQWGSLSYCHS